MGDQELKHFFRAWQWKREHRTDKERFAKPYTHTIVIDDLPPVVLSIGQARLKAQGFASTGELWCMSCSQFFLHLVSPSLLTLTLLTWHAVQFGIPRL